MNKFNKKLAVSSWQSAGKTNAFLPTAICQLLSISVLLLTANCLLPTSANAIGTTANTQILNTPTAVTLNFSNATGTGTVTRNSYNSVTSSVTAVYGVSAVITDVSKTTEAGVETTAFAHTITNASNTPVTLNANNGEFSLVGASPGDVADWKERFSAGLSKLESWVTRNSTILSSYAGHRTVVYNGRVYIIGGTKGGVFQDKVYVATINADGTIATWVTLNATPLPSPLSSHTASIYNGRIYVAGGQSAVGLANVKNTVYVADINANGTLSGWTSLASTLPSKLVSHRSVIYKGRIYVTGGIDQTGTFQNATYFASINSDGTLSIWTSTTVMPQILANHSLSAYDGRLYIVGGFKQFVGRQTTSYVADVNSDGSLSAWTELTSAALPVPIANHTVSIHNGKIYVVGGDTTSGVALATVYVSTINVDGTLTSWGSTASLPIASLSHSAEIYNGRIYLLGTNAMYAVFVSNFLDNQFTNIANDSFQGFSFYTTPSSYAFNNSQGLVTVNYFLSSDIPSSRIGNYTGFNATSYGGSDRVSALTTTTVQGPDVVLLSRSVETIAPIGLGYAGSATDTVPGSQLSYTIVLKNVGNTASNTVNVVEVVSNTSDVAYYYANATTANMTIGFVTNTDVNYSVDAGTSFTLNNSNLSGKFDTTIDAIKWTLDSIPAGEIATLNYRVVIKQN